MVTGGRSRRAGFALVEVACAFVVVTLLVFAVGAGGVGHGRGAAHAFHETLALQAAESRLEELRAGTLPVIGDDVAVPLDDATRARLPGGELRQSVRPYRPGLREVVVTVRWRPVVGGARSEITLTSLRAEGGR